MTRDLEATDWDAVVIGTGMGGGTLGYELARMGRRVLFLEKGRSTTLPSRSILGALPEETFDLARLSDAQHEELLARGGRNTEWIEDVTPGRKPKLFRPLVGSGTGGSSALYGMVTERFFREDFTPRANFADVGDSTVPEAWPVSYDQMIPWYRQAERLYRVRGTADPLRPGDDTEALAPPGPLTAGNTEVSAFLADQGLHPYGLHVACEYNEECRACQSYLCGLNCKNHAGNICVEPAIRDHQAALLDETAVERLEATRTRVTEVVARRRGETLRFRGKVVVLAAGALMTPGVLLNSRSADWPSGLANDHDVVGRNLMRHFIDVYFFRVGGSASGQVKEIGVNDLYQVDGQKFGNLQSFGQLPPYSMLMNANRQARRLLGALRALVGPRWPGVMDRYILLASIMEDLPYPGNRVRPGPVVQMQYTMGQADQKRHRDFTTRLRAVLGRYPGRSPYHLSGAKGNSGLGHVCGTCRFGDDPRTSALDGDNRAWGLDNLYVVDSSILPSSSGINPGLTLAANALRVAHALQDALP